MPTTLAIPITNATIWISAANILLLICIPIFVTRAFFAKKIVRYKATIDTLQKEMRELEGKKEEGKSEKGWIQQTTNLIAASRYSSRAARGGATAT